MQCETFTQKWGKFLTWAWTHLINMDYAQNLRKDPTNAKRKTIQGM